MISNRTSPISAWAVAATGLLAACSLNPKEDPTRYYVLAMIGEDPGLYEAAGLTGETEEQASLSGGPHLDISVGAGPITLPGYLKRTRMVTRQSDSELKYLETARWAQPLEEALAYAMAGNLSTLLWSDEVVVHPWYATKTPDYLVEADIARFERGSDGSAALVARWIVRDPDGVRLVAGTFDRVLPADSTSIASTVEAQSQLVAAMSREIADALRRVGS